MLGKSAADYVFAIVYFTCWKFFAAGGGAIFFDGHPPRYVQPGHQCCA